MYPLKMMIFHSCVSLPEGKMLEINHNPHTIYVGDLNKNSMLMYVGLS